MRIGVGALLLPTKPGYAKAGIGRYVAAILAEFVRDGRGHTFEVFVPYDVELPADWAAAGHVRWHRVQFSGRWSRLKWEHFGVKQALRDVKVDAYYSTAQSIPFPVGVPRSVMMHDIIPVLFPQYYVWDKALYQKLCIGYACRKSDLILTNSEATKADVMRVYGTASEKIVVTPFGPGNIVERRERGSVTPEERSRLGLPSGRFLFTLSTLEPRKNFSVMVPVMERLAKTPGCEDVELVIAGARGWKEAPIFQTIQEAGLAGKIHFLGYVDDADLPLLFAGCELFVFPSWYEGFGLPILEAMLLGAPIASSDRGSLREVGGDACVYFDPSRPDEIATAVAGLLQSPERQAAMVASNLERAQGFRWDECGRLTIEALARLGPPQ